MLSIKILLAASVLTIATAAGVLTQTTSSTASESTSSTTSFVSSVSSSRVAGAEKTKAESKAETRAVPVPLAKATGSCSNGRCVIYMNRAETAAMGWGSFPVPSWVPAPIRVVLVPAIAVHRYIARAYYNKGRCGVWLLSSRPWENQGFSSYAGGTCR